MHTLYVYIFPILPEYYLLGYNGTLMVDHDEVWEDLRDYLGYDVQDIF